MNRRRLGTLRRFDFLACLLFATGLAAPAPAAASPHHAHWHYMIGARANAGMNFMRQLHHEAATPGDFHTDLAKINAQDAEKLAREIAALAARTSEVSSPQDVDRIGPDLEAMRAKAEDLAARSAGLAASLGAEPSTEAEPSALREMVAVEAARLFGGFREILRLHKRAEEALGIPVPADPPPAP